MAVKAPYIFNRKNTLKLVIDLLFIFSVAFAYDGYLSQYEWSKRTSFYEKHVTEEGPDDTMKFNRASPFFMLPVAAVLGVILYRTKQKYLIADENGLDINGEVKIPYDSIQKIDKTNFEKKGYFVITYEKNGTNAEKKISYKTYDNLDKILETLIAKIS